MRTNIPSGMFRPPGLPEQTGQEFIELLNAGAEPINLTGARFDKGVTFAFPDNTVIAPGAYLVVAADRTAFETAHPAVPAASILAP